MDYQYRSLDVMLDRLIPEVAAIALDGPKGVGKTLTASRRVEKVLSLEYPGNRDRLDADFHLRDFEGTPTLFDEWQHFPRIWDMVRRRVDAGAAPGSFFLAGSATPHDLQGSHSGAGRVIPLRMRPMALHERGYTSPTISLTALMNGQNQSIDGECEFSLSDYALAIVQSGFPGILTTSEYIRDVHLSGYISRIIDREITEIGGRVRHPDSLRSWLRAYAAVESTTASSATVLSATATKGGDQPTKTTATAYRNHLTKLWLLDPTPGWTTVHNDIKRLQQAPKHHLADPALSAHLLGLNEHTLLGSQGERMLGPLFEALVTLTVKTVAETELARVFHLRENSGRNEIDLLVETRTGHLIAIEVKLKGTPTDRDVRHLHWLDAQAPGQVVEKIVITAGSFAFRRKDGVAVIPLAMLGH